MQRSTPFTRKTVPDNWVRNFDGTVSRCFASSVCSKLPLKAKAHVVRRFRVEVESIRGGGVGGAPPPRTGCAAGTYPTPSHFATQLPSFVPPCPRVVRIRTHCACKPVGFGVGRGVGGALRLGAGRRADTPLAGGIAVCRPAA